MRKVGKTIDFYLSLRWDCESYSYSQKVFIIIELQLLNYDMSITFHISLC